jgi:TolB-like protein
MLTVNSIAVLPFSAEGDVSDTDYLSDGVTEGVIDHLAQSREPLLKVIAFNSVMRYKGQNDANAIGRDLKVAAVVMGKVVQRLDALSISAELVSATDRSRLWGKTYKSTVSELPVVQQNIADEIFKKVSRRSGSDSERRPTKRNTDNADAYRTYLKGRYFWNQYTEEGWKKALDYFNQSIQIDPNYALAWAGIADTYYQLSSLVLRPREAIPRARAAAMRALALDDNLAEAHASLGMIKAQYDWDAKGAEHEFQRAIELNPNYAIAHQWYGMHLFATARFEAAHVELDKAQELDPLSLFVAVTTVWPLRHLGQDDLAVKKVEAIIEMYPNVPDLVDYLHEIRGEIFLEKRMYDEAVAELVRGFTSKALCGDAPDTIRTLESAYAAAGLSGYWRKQLELATRRYQQDLTAAASHPARYVSPYRLAGLHARLGDQERAFALLRECYENHDENLRWLKAESLRPNSPWTSIRSDPRFGALLHDLGLSG